MKRIQKKVKDLVEVRPHQTLSDYAANPAGTLASYHFTDFTAHLMVKYLEKLSAAENGKGSACALAGYRGVGKSHFLSVFGALAAQPELRSKISDGTVLAASYILKRTQFPVIYVRRGTSETFFEELKDAVAQFFSLDKSALEFSLADLLQFVKENSGAPSFVIIADTVYERGERVSRDDGAVLGKIAELAQEKNFFVGVALDDDIAGADGANADISRNFSIDYLDPEHLYKVVDKHIFQKNLHVQSSIHEVYTAIREALPHFRWSEQQFSSLYPLHPIIFEIAPFVRLYIKNFSLLDFASETGAKISMRPANSLIALDDVFDAVEHSLRKAPELKDGFALYDKINSSVIAQIPVMQRMQAKLVLKALFLLSLKGEGASAGEIAAAMLISDEYEPQKSFKSIEETLEIFAAAIPDEIRRKIEPQRETRYAFELSGSDKLTAKLNETAQNVSPAVVPKILRSIAKNKFSDWNFPETAPTGEAEASETEIVWRGSRRGGRLFWNLEGNRISKTDFSQNPDWEIFIAEKVDENLTGGASDEILRAFWIPAELKKDEIETILRYYVLLTDTELREQFSEQIRVQGQIHLNAVERIWNRAFLEEATVFIGGFDYKFTSETHSAQTLAEIAAKVLEPLFEQKFPEHPNYQKILGENEVSILVNDFFSGARPNLAEVQELAEIFAFPLGLVAFRNENLVIESEERLAQLAFVEEILSLVNQSNETLSLETVNRKLKQTEFGLGRESLQLILTAMVAQRQIEFVTSSGNRINRRSLDLKIIWSDIVGVSKPTSVIYSSERLTEWAKILTGAESLDSIETPEGRQKIFSSLEKWLGDWRESAVLERFAALPDDALNTRVWRLSTHVEKTFGSVAESVASALDKSISLEEGLHRIADAFSDSQKEFSTNREDLIVLDNFISGAKNREKIWSYLAVCEPTGDEETDFLRDNLFAAVRRSYEIPDETANRETEDLWRAFNESFAETFAAKHDAFMKSAFLREKINAILAGDDWWEFENLSRLSPLNKHHFKNARKIVAQIKNLQCRFDAREMLKIRPACACSFSFAAAAEWEKLPQKLEEIIENGLASLRCELFDLQPSLYSLIEEFSAQNAEQEFRQAAFRVNETLKSKGKFEKFSSLEFSILESARLKIKEIEVADNRSFPAQKNFPQPNNRNDVFQLEL